MSFVHEDPDELGYELVEECGTCKGSGVRTSARGTVICPDCEGAGFRPHGCAVDES